MAKLVLGIFVWGIAALLLAVIWNSYRKKRISWKRASFAAALIFSVRGILITILTGALALEIYQSLSSSYGKTTEEPASFFQPEETTDVADVCDDDPTTEDEEGVD